MNNRLSIFIDGGHYNVLQKSLSVSFNFLSFIREVRKCLSQDVDDLKLLHIFYYDCLPYTDVDSSLEEKEALPKRRAYFNFLKAQPAVRVREGQVVKRVLDNGQVVYQQKQVDLLLGLDIAEECDKKLMTHLVLVAGDGDLIPAVEYASHKGIQVWLFHGPRDVYSEALWSAADGRIEINNDFAQRISRFSSHKGNTID